MFQLSPLPPDFKFGSKRRLPFATRDEAIANLIKAAQSMVKDARWYPYRAKIDSLRVPLLQLRLAERKLKP